MVKFLLVIAILAIPDMAFSATIRETASGGYVQTNDDGTQTRWKQGVDLMSWHGTTTPSYQPKPIYSTHQRTNSYSLAQAANDGYETGRRMGEQRSNKYQALGAVLNNAIDVNQNDIILQNSKRQVLQKYPELNTPYSHISQLYLQALQRHPEYRDNPYGPILTMIAMEQGN